MTRETSRNDAFFETAAKVMPFGVSSNFRYWGEGENIGVARAEGTYFWDFDENKYIDYQLGFGPVILGHSHPPVVERVQEAIKHGLVFALSHEYEVKVAQRVIDMCPGIDKVRFANSGTEATMHALRIARAHTARDKVIKFEGQYHGMYDYMLFSTAGARVRATTPSVRRPGMGIQNGFIVPKSHVRSRGRPIRQFSKILSPVLKIFRLRGRLSQSNTRGPVERTIPG